MGYIRLVGSNEEELNLPYINIIKKIMVFSSFFIRDDVHWCSFSKKQ